MTGAVCNPRVRAAYGSRTPPLALALRPVRRALQVRVTCASGSVCDACPLVRLRSEVHYARDLSRFDVSSRVLAGGPPRNLAALANAAISLMRWVKVYPSAPSTNRHLAARSEQALQLGVEPNCH